MRRKRQSNNLAFTFALLRYRQIKASWRTRSKDKVESAFSLSLCPKEGKAAAKKEADEE